ncbi:LysR substrate-binding domain-containing protein [Trinickia caryophylli]|uniref:Transcriptional regulator, LysR family n=1 Tax=Trinickia caryophylli TaxID=28094 RepID=A0A1X7FT91_TRICW|nr:LysR substrate-binding domain-containing protein [Trinickia caryophylli]PMS11930.1 LysR family transcriptional regulator [Trinickia caryophylli]TRX13993.1 LysR family transcriptional regulator [Trinickia caryophylli]WQE15590.1 LysR substrate-binding domain-containing protein [Trinickia caryophylli]SMF58403.1 transcriptional regulator, LysR family [Trinickia caryophylli]GLU33652.1 transcriptional regulator [Trinickia caryophylli]
MSSSDLKIRQVEAFRALMQRQTVTRAALALHVSQPAVSRLLADFEASVGFTLFDRQQGRLVPTAEARLLYDEVERAFVGMDSITHAAQQIRAMRRGSLRIAGSPAVALELLPRAVTDFIARHPGVDVTLLTHSARTVVEMVASERVDVGFVAEAVPHHAVRLECIVDAPMRCIVPPAHRLARKRMLRPEDLRDEPFISFPHAFVARTEIDRVFAQHAVSRQLVLEAQLSQTVVALVANGAGVAFIDPVTAAFAAPRVAVRPFAPEIRDHVFLATPNGQRLPNLASAFVELATAALKATI